MEDLKSYAIIIPHYGPTHLLNVCLSSLHRETQGKRVETIVVYSSKEGILNLKSEFPNVKWIGSDRRLFPGEARNLGVHHSNSPNLIFLDSDCIASEGWINKMISHFEKGAIIFGGGIREINQSTLSLADFFLCFSEFYFQNKEKVVSFVPSLNFACTREAFLKVGGYSNERMGEDLLLCAKMENLSPIRFYPETFVYHENSAHFFKVFKHQFQYGYYSALSRQKVNLKGSLFARHTILSFLTPFIRVFLVSYRVQHLSKFSWHGRPIFFLLLGFSALIWGMGFIVRTLEFDLSHKWIRRVLQYFSKKKGSSESLNFLPSFSTG